MQEDYLTHYGVKGMKWGVRKDRAKSFAKSTSKQIRKYRNTKKNYSNKVQSRRKNKYKDLTTLSDTELRNRINRMQMERQYSSLLRDQRYAVTFGKNISDNILARNGNQVASQALKKGMRTAIKLT